MNRFIPDAPNYVKSMYIQACNMVLGARVLRTDLQNALKRVENMEARLAIFRDSIKKQLNEQL